MSFLKRLLAMRLLGDATLRIAERAWRRRVQHEDAARRKRLGDTEGQTARARAFAVALETSVLTEFSDPPVVKPRGWLGK